MSGRFRPVGSCRLCDMSKPRVECVAEADGAYIYLAEEIGVGGAVAFATLTPFFFLRSGMNVSLPLVMANLGLLAALLGVKLAAKAIAVHPLARRYAAPHAAFTKLLMSTGLTFVTISASYGYTAGIITRAQFSVLVTVVVLSAILPTVIAQRFFMPEPAIDSVLAGVGRSVPFRSHRSLS